LTKLKLDRVQCNTYL